MWRKQLAGGDVAVAVINMGEASLDGVSVSLRDAGFAPDTHVSVRDVFDRKDEGWHTGSYTLASPVPPHGAVVLRLSFVPQYTTPL